jgi:formylglycine-generating enzyme required for sulfatase activity
LGCSHEDIIEIDRRVLPKSPLLEFMEKYRLAVRDEDIALIDRGGLPLSIQTMQKSTISQTDSNPKLSVIEFTSVKVDSTGKIIDRPQGTAEIFVEDLGNDVSLTMVKISEGEFIMGSPTGEETSTEHERPQHLVKVPDFYMDQTLVTQAQWQRIMGYNPSKFTGDGGLPLEQVSWLEAQEFCKKLSKRVQREYRLPSEAEWEYACRSGTTTPFYFGKTISSEVVNYRAQEWLNLSTDIKYGDGKTGEFRNRTTLINEFSPNAFGLYDLHGNLSEWCLDHWHDNYQGAPSDGSAWLSNNDKANRIMRGGAWGNFPRNCRSARRKSFALDKRSDYFGFRVVCDIYRTL